MPVRLDSRSADFKPRFDASRQLCCNVFKGSAQALLQGLHPQVSEMPRPWRIAPYDELRVREFISRLRVSPVLAQTQVIPQSVRAR